MDEYYTKSELRALENQETLGKMILTSPKKFLAHYMPELESCRAPEAELIFQSLEPIKKGDDIYDIIMSTLNKANLCPGYTFVSTSHQDGADSETVVGGMYPAERAPNHLLFDEAISPRTSIWADIEVCIVCKDNMADPFDYIDPEGMADATEMRAAIDQILSFVQIVFDIQQRTSQFVLFFLDTGVRFLRFDRSGAFVTKMFDYEADPTYLVDFLWRLSHSRPSQRGHDDTAERIAHDSALGQQMRAIADKLQVSADPRFDIADYAIEQFKNSLDTSSPWWRLTVKDELADEGAQREWRYLVGKPHSLSSELCGRGSRGYVALDADSLDAPRFVYLKDTWRVSWDGIDKEGTTLRILNGQDVPFIPTVLHHGDLDQIATMPKSVVNTHPKTFTHYRMVVKEVGRPLKHFKNSKELIGIIGSCVTAHSKAYEAGYIHGDISEGNILIYTDDKGRRCGLLNDWELSRRVDERTGEAPRVDQLGTWTFLSVLAKDFPRKRISVQDELESFFHVILFMCIRHLAHNGQDTRFLIRKYFDDCRVLPNGDRQCGPVQRVFIRDGEFSLYRLALGYDRLAFLLPGPEASSPAVLHPINHLIDELFNWFAAYYDIWRQEHLTRSRTPAPSAPVVGSRPGPKMAMAMDARGGGTGDSVRVEDVAREWLTPEQIEKQRFDEETRLLAVRVGTHAAMLQRFADISDEDWPADDKCPYAITMALQRNYDTSQASPDAVRASISVVEKEMERTGGTDTLALSDHEDNHRKRTRSDEDDPEPSEIPAKRVHLI